MEVEVGLISAALEALTNRQPLAVFVEPGGRVYGASGGSSSYKRNLRRTAGVSVTSEISWCACSVSTWHAVPISA